MSNSIRQRPIPDVISEFQLIHEKHVLVLDDNLIGTSARHIARAKEMFRAMAQAKLGKEWRFKKSIIDRWFNEHVDEKFSKFL